jgi:hypothetical protein
MGLAVLLWTLGLSQRAVAVVLAGLEAGIHRSTVLRDIHRAVASLVSVRRNATHFDDETSEEMAL